VETSSGFSDGSGVSDPDRVGDLPLQIDSQAGWSSGDGPFFRIVILVFLGVFLFVLKDGLSPLLIGATLLFLILLVQRGVHFELGVGAVVVLLFCAWFLSDVASLLWPFLISFVLAYLLAPLVGLVERWISRTLAILLIVILMLGALCGIGVIIIPRIIDEVAEFGHQLPKYGAAITVYYERMLTWVQSVYDISTGDVKKWFLEGLPEVGKIFADQMTSALHGLSSGVAALLNLLMIPFVTFYVLKDYDRIKRTLRNALPRRHLRATVSLLMQIDDVLGQYVRGQFLVSSFIAVLTATGLALSGIRYAVLLGMMAGLFNLIPYVGLAISLGVAALVALLDVDPFLNLTKVVIVFVVVQGIEGNLLSPRVVGQKVGLHPVWVMFALVTAAHFWGFVGMIFAIPAAAVANIIFRIASGRYYASRYYLKESEGEQQVSN
jgi:predicted PurR-regulated permease PerM